MNSWVETTNASVQQAQLLLEMWKEGQAALFLTLLSMLLIFRQDSACISFCT